MLRLLCFDQLTGLSVRLGVPMPLICCIVVPIHQHRQPLTAFSLCICRLSWPVLSLLPKLHQVASVGLNPLMPLICCSPSLQ